MDGQVEGAIGVSSIKDIIALRRPLVAFFLLVTDGVTAEHNRILPEILSASNQIQLTFAFLDHHCFCPRQILGKHLGQMDIRKKRAYCENGQHQQNQNSVSHLGRLDASRANREYCGHRSLDASNVSTGWKASFSVNVRAVGIT
jgi:hypothetical protein